MELSSTNSPAVPAKVYKFGQTTFAATAEQHLKIETAPGGLDILDVPVPIGKKWGTVEVTVKIVETAA